jgi:hypothetical protein
LLQFLIWYYLCSLGHLIHLTSFLYLRLPNEYMIQISDKGYSATLKKERT